MKKIIKAFTLIELLVVITIIILISSSWVFYFLDFVKNKELNNKILLIQDDLENLEKEIKKYKISDYEAIFSISSTGYYIQNTNKIWWWIQSLWSINQSWTWTITTSWIWTGTIKIFKDDKLFVYKNIYRTIWYDFNFNEWNKFKISWTLSWVVLNNINLNKFDNINSLELIKISDQKSWSTNYKNWVIENIWWKRKIKLDWTETNEMYLFFDSFWKQWFLKIEK